ncbi:MAG: transporter [Treponema sp.]|nr:transporter [Treponema sp.]
MEEQPSIARRIARSAGSGVKTGLSTAVFLIKIMVPVSLAAALLDWSGLLYYVARFLAPAMRLIGLPGEAALALVSGFLLTNYSAIAVITVLGLPLREASIVAIVCLTAHNLIVETAVMRKAGSSGLKMVLLRLGMGLAAGWVFNLLLPGTPAPASHAPPPQTLAVWSTLPPALSAWGLGTARLVLKIVILVVVILVTQRLLEEFHAAEALARLAAPFMKGFGLPDSASLLWLVVNLVGYTYGAAVIMEQIEGGKMKRQEADLFNHHAAVSHSLLEDTVLYAALGIPIFWLTVPRLVMAVLVVWAERLRRTAFRRSFRVGTV